MNNRVLIGWFIVVLGMVIISILASGCSTRPKEDCAQCYLMVN